MACIFSFSRMHLRAVGCGLMALCFFATDAFAQSCPRTESLPLAPAGRVGYELTTKDLYLCDGVTWKPIPREIPASDTSQDGGTTTPPPTCYKGLIYRLGFGCCVEVAANLALLELVLGIKLKLCPAI